VKRDRPSDQSESPDRAETVAKPTALVRRSLTLSSGTKLSFLTAGQETGAALLLLHGFPNSAQGFREVIPVLARDVYVIAPDLPGFGDSEPLPTASFAAFTRAITELLDHLGVRSRFIYLHDFGAPVGLSLAMSAPERVLGLIIQNANAHETGFGPQWADTRAFWSAPNARNEAAATAHLTLEGTRDQYIAGIPPDIAARISPQLWEEDWRVMCLPGRMATQRALIADYAQHVARFGAIADYLKQHQPPALMLWGRHDAFFDLAETVSWMKTLPRMEAHVLDGGHLLLETDAERAAALMADFVRRVAPAARQG
jgi:pimeloyl-ACP methyl ester carboxylesterase